MDNNLSYIKEEFSAALLDLVSSAAKLPPVVDHPIICDKIAKVCSILCIAHCEVYVTYSKFASYDQSIVKVFYTREGYDKTRPFSHTLSTPSNQACYSVFPFKGSDGWSDEIKELINTFLASMFVINGRSNLMNSIQKVMFHDEQLDTFNLRYFLKTTNEIIEKGELLQYNACRFNLRNFSSVNSKIGKTHGTIVMKRFVQGISDMFGEDGFVCRLGGDNFLCLFKKELFTDVRDYLIGTDIPTDFRGLSEVTVSAYTGFLTDMSACNNIDDVMEGLAISINMAKFRLKQPFVIYNEKIKAESAHKKIIEDLFFDAIENEEFLVYYQPKVNIENYTISGAEALCRWMHDGELIPPMRFIPTLEQSNNICVLDFYMLEHVCRDMRRWLDNGWPAVKVSVNLSRVHLGDEKLNERIKAIINKYDIPHELIEIELTETTTDVDFTELKRIVGLLHNDSISTSVDDFGVGYSSLNLIRDLPWNVLKIDRSFLPSEKDDNQAAKKVMLGHVIAMAHQLGLECVVEGVETIEQVELLKELECFQAQGFYFDRPLPVEHFEKRIMGVHSYKSEQ